MGSANFGKYNLRQRDKKYMQSQLALVITVTGQFECKPESKCGKEPREVANMFALAEQEAGGIVIVITLLRIQHPPAVAMSIAAAPSLLFQSEREL